MKKTLYKPILINTALIICFTFSLYGLAMDLPLIQIHKEVYILGRIIFATICLFFFIQVNFQKKQYQSQVPLIYTTIVLYCIHGNYYVNGYYLAFMQAVAGFSLFFPMPKKYYYPISFGGNSLIIASIWMTKYNYSDNPTQIVKFNLDTTLGVLLISLICLIGYLKITLVREQKQMLAEKFLNVGRYFGSFVHDLKGMISSPIVYAELLSAELKKESPNLSEIREIANNLKSDIQIVHQKVININQLSRNSPEIAPINIRALVNALEQHFFLKDNLQIKILDTTTSIIGNEYTIRSILLNLINNSKEHFVLKNVENRIIEIIVEPQKMTFKDNGGGFSKMALKKIHQNTFFSDKKHGSGMGLFIVMEYMREFNGHARFKNRSDGIAGVQVELTFSRREHA